MTRTKIIRAARQNRFEVPDDLTFSHLDFDYACVKRKLEATIIKHISRLSWRKQTMILDENIKYKEYYMPVSSKYISETNYRVTFLCLHPKVEENELYATCTVDGNVKKIVTCATWLTK